MLDFTMKQTMAGLTTLCSTLPRFPSYRVSSTHRVNSAVNTIGIPLANGLMQDHGTLIQRLRLFF